MTEGYNVAAALTAAIQRKKRLGDTISKRDASIAAAKRKNNLDIFGVFKVYLVETRERGNITQAWCPTGNSWYSEKAPARDQAGLFRLLHGKTKVYRVRRYLPTAEVIRG